MLTEKEQERFVYIYNPSQASFYMENGIMAKSTGVHPETKRVWYKFSFYESTNVYDVWCSRKK